MNQLNVPIVLLIFNRPDVTRRVFEAIRAARPRQLLVVADGPRPSRADDQDNCAAAREAAQAVDWPCDVRTNFAEVNLGLRARVSSGIDWAFTQVEEAITLEDDCLPHPSFFGYCAELIERYRHDHRIMAVNGENFQQGKRRGAGSYYFSRYCNCWGWATWRDRWRLFDLSLSSWPKWREEAALARLFSAPDERAYWRGIFEDMYQGKINSWAYAWLYAGFVHAGLSAHPNCNLVSNIGFGDNATHTDAWVPFAALRTRDLGEVVHPALVEADQEADRAEFRFVRLGEKAGPIAAFQRRFREVRRRIVGRVS